MSTLDSKKNFLKKITLVNGLPDFTSFVIINKKHYYSLDKDKTFHLFISHEDCVKRFNSMSQKHSIDKETFKFFATEFLKFLAQDHNHQFTTDEDALNFWIEKHQVTEINNSNSITQSKKK
jgi:hypothetical protein